MTIPMDKALDAVAKLAPQDNDRPALTPRQHGSLSAEMKALQNEKREAIDCLRRITAAMQIRGPLGTTAYIINDATMQSARDIVARHSG